MITTIQFKTLDDLYKFYNDAIFNSEYKGQNEKS